MKQKVIIGGAVILLLVVVGLMIKDMFVQENEQVNPYEYSIDEFKDSSPDLYCYEESERRSVEIEDLAGIAVDNQNHIYLAGSNKIMIIDPNWKLIREFGIEGEAKSLHLDHKGQIVIALTDHIETWSVDGEKLMEFERRGNRSLITSICSDEDRIFIADAGLKEIHAYNYEGDYVFSFGGKDTISGRKGFIIPSPYFDIAIGREGQLWAVNSGMHSLEAFNDYGKLISSWKKSSMGPDGFSGCCNPSHMAILSDGRFVSSEKGLVRVKIHNQDGSFHCQVAGPDSFEDDETGLDIAVSNKDDIFIIVPSKNEIRKYIPIRE